MFPPHFLDGCIHFRDGIAEGREGILQAIWAHLFRCTYSGEEGQAQRLLNSKTR